LPERAGRLRALRGGIRRAGPTSPALPNRPFAVRKADGPARRGRALQSGEARNRISTAFATHFQFEGRRSSAFESPTAVRLRTAPRAAGARCKANRHEKEAASPLRCSSDPRDRRKPAPAITHLLSAPRTAPRAEGARCKAKTTRAGSSSAYASPFRSAYPASRPAPAITYPPSAPRAAKPKNTSKKQRRSAPAPRPARPPPPIRRPLYPPDRPPRPIPVSPRTHSSPHPPAITRTPTILQQSAREQQST
jgi:hypothetical protein